MDESRGPETDVSSGSTQNDCRLGMNREVKAGSQGSGFYRLEDMDEFCSQEHLVDLCVDPLGGPGGDDCKSWRTNQRHPQEPS